MTDRPILFSAQMVRALIAGRKTQTRRIIKPRKHASLFDGEWEDGFVLDPGNEEWRQQDIPIKIGDRLWVRESVTRFDKGTCDQHVWYRAGHNTDEFYQGYLAQMAGSPDGEWPLDVGPAGGAPYKVPSIFMPRWASRLTLIVTGVRVERLQDISEADAIAEGVEPSATNAGWWRCYTEASKLCPTARDAYGDLWNSINGEGSWRSAPWVVAYTFGVIKQNIDQIEQVAA